MHAGLPERKHEVENSKQEVNRNLKHICEDFFDVASVYIVYDVSLFKGKVQNKQIPIDTDNDKLKELLEKEVYDKLKAKNKEIIEKMHLYFAAAETEVVLYSRIKANVIDEIKILYQVIRDNNSSGDGIENVFTPEEILSEILLEPYKQ